MSALAALWGLVTAPLRTRWHEGLGTRPANDHGAPRASPRRRAAWVAFQCIPAALFLSLGVLTLASGESARGVTHLCVSLLLATGVFSQVNAYRHGYSVGVTQTLVDVHGGTFRESIRRRRPHPSDGVPPHPTGGQ